MQSGEPVAAFTPAPFPIAPALELFASLFVIVVARYFLLSGGLYLWIWKLRARQWDSRRLYPGEISPKQIRDEVIYSIVSSLFFAGAGTWILRAWAEGKAGLYIDPAAYGWVWLPVSFVFLVLAHETYFYWTHRLMHIPAILRRVHHVHHASIHPTPFASFSFHPIEALIEAIIIPLLVLFIPIHVGVFVLFLLFMTVLGVINHLGYELYPRGFETHGFFQWWISATHHQEHHEKFKKNFGLYFTFWDHWMGTQDPRPSQRNASRDQPTRGELVGNQLKGVTR